MKKWLVYLLGIITGVILTFAFAFYVNLSNNSGIVGLEMFEEPGDYMEYSQFEVCLLYTSPSPRDAHESRMPSSA